YQRDVDYVIQDGEVKIVDEFTGRIMEGRRWSEGLHQAVEAKEGVAIKEEHVTLATITLQNYFRLYDKLAGMTGTAKTEEKEFQEIYDLSVVEIPTNVAVERDDRDDLIYKTKEAKYNAAIDDIKERHEVGQPVLVGTISVEVSEHLSTLLERQGIPHNVLNAKQHEREAEIIMDAGERGAVTIATNMAGRGVDIKLGEGVVDLGGLYVLGTERHEARRIDNQLRGRSGRQGDPGESRFYLSAQDDLVRLFAGDRIYRIMERFKLPDDEPMEQKILSSQIENAQKKVEEQNFVSRKNVLKYDDVMNVQRQVIYEQRRRVLEGDDLSEDIRTWIDELIERTVLSHTQSEYQEEWDLDSLFAEMATIYDTEVKPEELDLGSMTREELIEDFVDDAQASYELKEEELGPHPDQPDTPLLREIERFLILQVVDLRWREHLDAMEYLRDGIHLRAMAQKDPLVEYRAEGHVMFEELGQIIREEVVRYLFHVEIEREDAQQLVPAAAPQADAMSYEHQSLAGADAIAAAGGNGAGDGQALQAGVAAGTVGGGATSVATGQRTVSAEKKVGRNDPCWCGSGKKFKKCHGA
ncbi:MAG TPA: SEC-C metal-binding domain-containing protein, partial [Gaiellaceae bacterium]